MSLCVYKYESLCYVLVCAILQEAVRYLNKTKHLISLNFILKHSLL